MRCYFHLVNDRELLADPYGIEVTDLVMAHAEARRAIEELLQDDPALEHDMSRLELGCRRRCWKVPPITSPRRNRAVECAEQIALVPELRNARVT